MGQKIYELFEKIVYGILQFLFRIAHKDLTDSMFEGFMQFIKFGIVGVSNTVISYVLYAGFLILFRRIHLGSWDYLLAQVLQFILSVLWSFFWNNKFVFTLQEGEKRNLWGALFKTYVSYSFTGLFLSSVLLILWVQVFHISEFIAPIINLVVSVPLNFLINKFWAFKKIEE